MRFSFLVILLSIILISTATDKGEFDEADDREEPGHTHTEFEDRNQDDSQFDEDEFITIKQTRKQEEVIRPPPEVAKELNDDWPAFITKWWMEFSFLIFLVVYGLFFSLGSSRNEAVATAWAKKYQRLFLENFFQVGIDGSLLVKQSQNSFTLTAAGRVNCLGLTSTLQLKRRHDLVLSVAELVFASQDKLIIDVPMEAEMNPIAFAILPTKDEKLIKKESNFKDINQLTKKRDSPLGDDFVVYSESNELMGALFADHRFRDTLTQAKGILSLIHFTDQCQWNPKYKKILRFVYTLPTDLDHLDAFMEVTMSMIDTVANVKLSPALVSKAIRSREEFSASKTAQEGKAELERRAEERYKRDQEALQRMTPAEREKEELKRAKKALKKKQGSKIKVIK